MWIIFEIKINLILNHNENEIPDFLIYPIFLNIGVFVMKFRNFFLNSNRYRFWHLNQFQLIPYA